MNNINIDTIFRMLDEKNAIEEQEEGLRLASRIQCLSIFIMPISKDVTMSVWNNCAKLLASKSDEELSPILSRLFDWIEDSTLPGALLIAKRLHCYERNEQFNRILRFKMKIAEKLGYSDYIHDLHQLVTNGDFSEFES